MMIWWYWLVIGLFLLVSEVVTPGGFFLFFFGVAAILVGGAAGIGILPSTWLQVAAFSILSIVLVVGFRNTLLRRMHQRGTNDKPVDTLVGESLILQSDLAPQAIGKAELRGTSWSVENIGQQKLKKGDRCSVIAVQGLTLQVK